MVVTAAAVHLGRHKGLLDPLGGVFFPGLGVLAVADLHLEKGSAAARRGSLVPPWDTGITLDRPGGAAAPMATADGGGVGGQLP